MKTTLNGLYGRKKTKQEKKSIKIKIFSYPIYKLTAFPMDTSSSIRHRFDVKIPPGKFVKITSILKGESTWKLWHRFDVDISTWIRLSKSMSSPRGFFYVASTSNRRNFCTRCFHFLTFSALGTYSKLFWYNAESL